VALQVLHRNKAVALYRRLGFEPCGETATHLAMRWQPR
jgi:ribosomal protein S18 acetylase RimI-like enzyme